MNIAFRADASFEIGSGHIMRCLALADCLSSQGINCVFLTRSLRGNLESLILSRGYKAFMLKNSSFDSSRATKISSIDYLSMLGVSVNEDIHESAKILSSLEIDWMIVDHYALDFSWESAIRPFCNKILSIDDLANRIHDCDILLDQNLGKNKDDYLNLVSTSTTCLMGAKYALLRQQFNRFRAISLARRESFNGINHILVSMGGVDYENITTDILDVLSEVSNFFSIKFKVTVVMGQSSLWKSQVKAKAERVPYEVRVLSNVNYMARLMCEADLAIGAAGSTSWERCCLGLPTIQLVLAENQQSIAEALKNVGAAVYVNREELSEGILNNIDNFLVNPSLLRKMSNAASNVTDGLGAKRVTTAITGK